jgi:hypothetical protein
MIACTINLSRATFSDLSRRSIREIPKNLGGWTRKGWRTLQSKGRMDFCQAGTQWFPNILKGKTTIKKEELIVECTFPHAEFLSS